MLKALIRKDLLSLGTMFLQGKKDSKKRSKGAIVGFILLYAFLYIMMAALFLMMAFFMGPDLFAKGEAWVYFIVMGYLSIFFGIFGSVFSTYTMLYQARDNEMLLSLPIEPWKILFTRIVTVYLFSLLYGSAAWLPGICVYLFSGFATVTGAIYSILMFFEIGFLISAISCILGWVVAEISSRVRSKKLFSLFFMLVLILGLMVFRFKANDIFENMMENAEVIGEYTKSHIYPFYLMGAGAAGDTVSFLLFTAGVAVLFGLVYYVLSKTFFSVTMREAKVKKAGYSEKAVQVHSVRRTLFSREMKHFFSSLAYMLNMGMSSLFMFVAAGALLVFSGTIREAIGSVSGIPELGAFIAPLLPAAAALAGALIAGMGPYTAASVSTEGKSIWILQTMPSKTEDILYAKIMMHMVLIGVPSLVFMAAATFVLKLDLLSALEATMFLLAFELLHALVGLFEDLRHVNLSWTNEAIPVKQGIPVMVGIFGGWGAVLLIGVSVYFLMRFVSVPVILGGWIVLLLLLCLPLLNYSRTKGVEIYNYAS